MDNQTYVDEIGVRRMRDVELVVPVVVGTIAFNLGKKATEYMTHRWTVYLRGPNNEDLSHIISKVQFDLHQTFNNPNRMAVQQPFEVTEHGWGEFDIVIHVFFTADAGEGEVVIYHKLKLYEEGEQMGHKQDPKRPVLSETYEELVFVDPRPELYQRIAHHRAMPLVPPSQLAPYYPAISDAEELAALRGLRAKVAAMAAELRGEYGAPTPGAGVMAASLAPPPPTL
eukprot:CAMPEP_0202858606 /NCGR_PEP_ID=MMETSP1391-20130828/1062_1 /ASSEMBLY_ACC=CAM_ASM_000867 /TAXON_ID=1034604 /ORGANISM="Chlamydomonas leiostraca, Strain SAG 11-49" /LENGTH=226 /DNA_ID=CAMNT_0049537535 /DNA_START=105 /DNA_END=785 /DNA_ORIENTATION=+